MEHQHQKSWFGRNWPWLLPVGGCLTIILLFIFGVGAAIFGVAEALKGSEPYEFAVEESINSPELMEILGEPIKTDGFMEGTVNFKNESGRVDIKIPLRGPKGAATIEVKGTKEDGIWTYEKLFVTIKETNEKIDLLEPDLNEN
ncbi:MAG: cytochrome c oxidase assembly factor 1 family protein [Bacteroidia bacterium]|nr:cytochrome c oxidase assembly factor 1 family protein [Bacteroidia bacterium]